MRGTVLLGVVAALAVSSPAGAASVSPESLAESGWVEFRASGSRVPDMKTAWPHPVPVPTAAESDWNELLEKVQQRGAFRERDGQIPANFGLADVRGDAQADHLADYINVWGYGSPRMFYPKQVTLVSEKWEVATDGNWHIHQWLFWIAPEGQVLRVAKQFIVQTRQRTVLDVRYDPVEPADPAAQAKLKDLLAQWRDF